MAQAYDAIIATIVVAGDATSVTKEMVKSTTWRQGTSGTWLSTNCTLTAGNTYQFRTPLSGMDSATTAILPNIKASVTVAWDTTATPISTLGNYFMHNYARDCSNLTSLSVPDTSGLTSVGTYFMYGYARGCSNLTSLSVPDTSGLTSVGGSFTSVYALDCISLTSLILPDSTGWFGSHNIDWRVPSGRLGYLYGYTPNSTSQTAWRALTVSGKTLYTNYIRDTGHVLVSGGGGTEADSERGLYVVGYSTSTSERGLYLQGSLTSNSTRGLYIEGFVDTLYSRENSASLKADDSNLSTMFSEQDYIDVATDDDTFVDLEGTAQYFQLLFKELNGNENNTDSFKITWKGKSTLAPSSSAVYLQIYNRTTESWTTLVSNSSANADTEFTLEYTVNTDLSDYYDENYIISVRVYQNGVV